MTYQELIISHYEKVWGGSATMYFFDKGPIDKLPYDFRVLEFKPNSKTTMWTYATCCMSQEDDNFAMEVHMFSNKKDESIVELLTAITYYHRTTSKFGLNHTFDFGRPWQDHSSCTFGFISLPYLHGPDLENMTRIKFYWIIPITKRELEYKISNGTEALEQLLEDNEFDYLDPKRKSLI